MAWAFSRVVRAHRCVVAASACIVLACAPAARSAGAIGTEAISGPTASAEAAPVAFQFEEPITILSTQDMDHDGLMFPDGPLGFVRQHGRNPYYVYGSASSSNGVGRMAHLPAGTYAFAGTLKSLHPARWNGSWPTWSLTSGRQQPSPDASDFDRDYAGGGPTYQLLLSDSSVPSNEPCGRISGSRTESALRRSVLLQIYHGEYRLLEPQALPAYGGSGMAISCDGGLTFEKIGQILAPHVSRDEFLTAHGTGGLWADGTMIEASARGEHGCGPSACQSSRARYYYLIFTDHNALDEQSTGLSVARVSADDLANAVRQRRPPLFRKYFNPNGVLSVNGDWFTEPGVGGRSTPVLFTPGQHMNTPGVVYDAYLRKFVLYYQTNQKRVELRTSKNLFSWSAPTVAYQVDQDADRRVFYPSVAADGPDPQVLGRTFYLYFLVRDQIERRFVNPQLLREQVSATR